MSSAADEMPGMAENAATLAPIDPTKNVLDLVAAAIQRQDDLRRNEASHLREMISLRALHSQEMRRAEAERIDAIRAVDVGNVQRAAEVQSQQALTLQNQVTTSAETLRTQVAAAATAAATSLAAALEPIQKDIADLRRVQYEAAGGKIQSTEAMDVKSAGIGNTTAIIGAAVALVVILITLFTLYAKGNGSGTCYDSTNHVIACR